MPSQSLAFQSTNRVTNYVALSAFVAAGTGALEAAAAGALAGVAAVLDEASLEALGAAAFELSPGDPEAALLGALE